MKKGEGSAKADEAQSTDDAAAAGGAGNSYPDALAEHPSDYWADLLAERIANGGEIDWPRYCALASWTAEEFARLVNKLDPGKHPPIPKGAKGERWDRLRAEMANASPNAPWGLVQAIERQARSERAERMAPAQWVEWIGQPERAKAFPSLRVGPRLLEHLQAQEPENQGASGQGPLGGKARFWTIADASAWLRVEASLPDSDIENIAGLALNAARMGQLVTVKPPSGAKMQGQRSAGINGAPWYFLAEDFNRWLDGVNLTSYRLPTDLPPLNRSRAPTALAPARPAPSVIGSRPPMEEARRDRLISKAPEPISPLRFAAHSTSDYSGSREAATERPDWTHWPKIPRVELWQAVCLSLDMEPRLELFSRNGWGEGPPEHPALDRAQFPSDEAFSQFFRRLDVLMGHLYEGAAFSSPQPASVPYRQRVLLREFAAFAVHFWPGKVPRELQDLAQENTHAQPAARDGATEGAAVKADPLTAPNTAHEKPAKKTSRSWWKEGIKERAQRTGEAIHAARGECPLLSDIYRRLERDLKEEEAAKESNYSPTWETIKRHGLKDWRYKPPKT